MRHLPALLFTTGLLVAGVFLLALGLHQVRARRRVYLTRRWTAYRGTGDVLIGVGTASAAAYHLNQIIAE